MSQKIWYEVHISVNEQREGMGIKSYEAAMANAKRLIPLCGGLDAKILLIELDEGAENPLHLMVTKNQQFENDQEAEAWADQLKFAMVTNGWHVERMKLEAQMGKGPGEYYEAHWRVGFLRSEARKVHAFISRYPQFKYSWSILNRDKQYFTARYYEYDPVAAQRYFDELTRLVVSNFTMVRVETERVVIDTNPRFDLGWAYVSVWT